MDPWHVGPAFLAGLVLGALIGLLAGYIRGRWDRKSEDAYIVTLEDLEAVRRAKEQAEKST